MWKKGPGLIALGWTVLLFGRIANAQESHLGGGPAVPLGGTRGDNTLAAAEPGAAVPEPFAGVERLNRDALIAAVLARNPNLEAARQAWRSGLERVPQVTALEDPRLSYGVAPLSAFSSEARFGQKLEVGQRIPFPGTLRLRGEQARAQAEASRAQLESLHLELALAASLLFDDYYLVARALDVNAEHVRLLEDFQRIATVRYAAGLVSQNAPLQAEVELARLVHRVVVLETDRVVVRARLNALLHRRPAARLPPPPQELQPPTADPLEELGVQGSERLQELALASRPELAAAAADVEAGQATVGLAKLERFPSFAATSSYNSMWRTPEHRWTVGISIHLPIQRRRIAAGVTEAEARLAAAHARRQAVEDEIRAEVHKALEWAREARHVITLYQSRLLPAARDQVRSARTSFETGRDSFLALIEAEKNLRSVELGYEEALTDHHRRLAQLRRAVASEGGIR